MEPFLVFNAVSRISLSNSTQEIFALKVVIELRSRRKQGTVFGPQFLRGGGRKNLLRQFIFVVHLIPRGKVWLRTARAKPGNEYKRRVFKGTDTAVSGPTFMKFWAM